MKPCITCIGLVLASFLFAAEGAVAQTPTLSLQAVKINDVVITPSNSITVKRGDIIVAEIFVSNWSPDGERLWGYQADIPRTSFGSGTTGAVKPVGWDRPLSSFEDTFCATENPECPPEFPECFPFGSVGFGLCVGENFNPTQGLFIVPNRTDWVFFDPSSGSPFPAVAFVDFSGPLVRYAGGVILASNAQAFVPPPKYCGTLKLEVSNDASGTFSFEIDPIDSTLLDENIVPIGPLTLIGLTIEIDPCGNGVIDTGEECDDGLSNSDTLPDACRTNCILSACGDNVTDSGEACDAADLGDCPGSCAEDCTCLPVGIPTVSAWGLAILTLSLLAAGRVYFARRSTNQRV